MANGTYKRDPVSAPRLSGTPLRLFVETLETPLGAAVLGKIARDSGLDRFRETNADGAPPTQVTLPNRAPLPEHRPGSLELAELAATGPVRYRGAAPETVADFARAYRAGELSPMTVADRVIGGIREKDSGDDRLGWFIAWSADDIRKQAEASAQRFREGRPLSVFDGVPVAVKDEMDQVPFPTTGGTAFLGKEPARRDAEVVARLRAAGALLIGKTNMHEAGINPIGLNPHHGATRNPWNRARITGGSSSGSAAVVAAGLSPVAIGADGGGSIRIPAALCGVAGLKATWTRISEHGMLPLCWTVGHVGPLGATVRDVAAAYAVIAGPDPRDELTLGQPPLHLAGLEDHDLRGVRLGISRPWFEDADSEVVARCDAVIRTLVDAGATVVEIPPPDLNTVLWTHAALILSEMATTLLPYLREDSRRFGLDVRTNLAIARFFESPDYVHALRHRHRMTQQYLELMQGVDVIVTPTTASTAPEIPEHALPAGESNLVMTDALMRFIRIPNITGFPALSVPAGFDHSGLPIGCQFIGRPWEEHLLLKLGLVAESAVEHRRPVHRVDLLAR
ncbi:MAG: amidase [Myxococcaceae bacterium]